MLSALPAQGATGVAGGVQWLASQIQADGSLVSESASIATVLQCRAETDRALRQLASTPSVLTNLVGTQADDNTEYLARQVIVLSNANQDVSHLIGTLSQRQNYDGGFGGADGHQSNALDTAWALLAFNTAGQNAPASAAIAYLQTTQEADGAYAVNDQESVYISAYVLMALRSYASTSDVSSNIQSLSSYLLAQQTAPGVWESPFMTALVYSALHDFIPLSPIGIQAQTYLLSFQLADGSWNDDPYETAVILQALWLTGTAPANPWLGTIQGKIVDGQTGLPMPGVAVTLGGASASTVYTGTDGTFSATALQPGSYALTMILANYGTLSTVTSIKAGQVLNLGSMLMTKAANAATGTVYGIVTDAGTGARLTGATISVGGVTMQTDVHGSYQILNVPSGDITISASMPGYQTMTSAGHVYAGGSLLFSPALSTTGPATTHSVSVSGIVLDSGTNAPLVGVAITVTDGSGSYILQSDAGGNFSRPNLVADVKGGVNLVFALAGYITIDTYVPIAGQTAVNIGQVRLRKTIVTQLLPDLVVQNVSRLAAITDPQTLALSGSVSAQIGNIGSADAPANIALLAFYDRNGNGVYDEGVDEVLGRAATNGAIPVGGTQIVSIPVQGTALFRDAPIYLFVDSTQQVVEGNKSNNVGITSSACQAMPGPAVGSLSPKLKWEWRGSPVLPNYNQVMMAPMVARIQDTNGDGKIDDKDIPAVIFSTFSGFGYTSDGVLRAISGLDGHDLWTVTDPAYRVLPSAHPAVADIDGDGIPEIIVPRDGGGIIVFDNMGKVKWQNIQPPTENYASGIAVADLDGDGKPEIIHGNYVYNADGTLKWHATFYSTGLPVVADLNMDGHPMVVAGGIAYMGATGQVAWQNTAVGSGFSAIGNFNEDPYPEIVVAPGGRLFLLDHLGNIIWGPVAIPGGGGGPPTIADMDGDGVPEIGVAGASFYSVFKADGSLLWKSPTSDYSSQETGSSVFDFDGSGQAKVVYSDENNLRIFDGKTGAVLYQTPNSNGTLSELPVIVDVDNDNHAEIVLSSNNVFGGSNNGIRVFADANNSWVNTRKIWNQHTYHITNINDDGTVPRIEQNSWQLYNSYRLNQQPGLTPLALPDITASYLRVQDHGGTTPSIITVRVGNGGAAPVNPGVSVAFYNGDPAFGGVLLGTSTTATTLGLGQYEDINFSVATLSGMSALVVIVDDNGNGAGAIQECDKTNNRTSLQLAALPGSFSLTASTDQGNYGANANIQIAASVANNGSIDGAALVRFVVQTGDGTAVAILQTQSLIIAHNSQKMAMALWNTGTILTGTYQIVAQLVDANGVPYAQTHVPFSITAGTTTLISQLTTNKQSYLPSDVVQMNSRVSNTTANQLLQNLTVVTTVTSPDGTVFITKTEMLPQLAQGNLKDYVYSIPLNFAPAGVYNANLLVEDATGAVIATANANFTVQSTAATGAGLTGTLSVSPKQLPQGASIAILYSARNVGNSALTGLPLTVSIIDPVAQRVMAQYLTTQTIAVGGNYTAVSNWTSTGTVGTNYVAVLSATLGGQTLNLAQDTFTLIASPIKLGIQQSIPALGSVLALISCQSTDRGDDKRGDSSVQYCGEGEDDNDGHQNDNNKQLKSLCLPQRVQAVTAALTATGLPYHLSQTVSDFKQAFRSGLYNTYWISNAQYVLGNALAGEVGEAVYAGNSLILDGGILARNHVFDALSGVSFQGNIGQQQPITLDGLLYPTAQTLPTLGQAQWLKPASGAVIQATFNYAHGYPGNDHDNHADSHAANQSQTVPGMVSNAYGNGIVLTLGFDLSNTLTTYSVSWQTPLDIALAALTPTANQPTRLSPGTVLPVTTEIDNQAQTVDVDVKTRLPGSARYLNASPSGSFNATNNTLDWMFNLPAQQTRSQTLWFLVPASAGDYSVQTLVGTVGSDNTLIPYGQPLSLSFSVITAAQTGANAIALLQSYALRGHDDQNLRDRLVTKLQEALNNFSKNTLQGYETTIADLLDIANRLGDLTAVDTTAARADIDALLQEAQWRWTLLPQPVPTNKRH